MRSGCCVVLALTNSYAQAGTVCSSPHCRDRTVAAPVVRAGCGYAFHDSDTCRPAHGQCPTCPARYDAIVAQLCESRNELVDRLSKELAGEDVSADAALDDECDDDDEHDLLHVGDDTDDPSSALPLAEITIEQFQRDLAAALRKW